MKLIEIRRYPIKSLGGEQLETVEVEQRGLVGDRLWAVRDADGKLGSGKSTRRFRRMPGLLSLRGHSGDPVPVVELPDGRRFTADEPVAHEAVSEVLARPVTIEREASIMHHDEGPVSLISTAALRRLHDLLGEPVAPVRFRANLLVDTPGSDFVEDGWLGRDVRIGSEVVLRPRQRLTRCVMIDLAQEGAPEHGELLRTVGEHHDMTFGVWATVERPGRVTLLDTVEPV
ncbi:MOSC domain-containing protein [Micromonospora phytophila]|uniref:MOSC domain-containing protein n=1 Tax=Micromonospora phytophila TaxID=709888 RepID=UPI00202F2B6D|nr:MOSC N-terminal beta barrel domain-containing protein [Micromonospora phytophila]MCM0677654.1 MOSC domain-containing protein [Micromonospora phytophila]